MLSASMSCECIYFSPPRRGERDIERNKLQSDKKIEFDVFSRFSEATDKITHPIDNM